MRMWRVGLWIASALGGLHGATAAMEISRPSAPALYVLQAPAASTAGSTLRLRIGYPITLRGAPGSSSYSIDAADRDPREFGFTGLQLDLGSAPLDAATFQARATSAVNAGWPSLQGRLTGLMQSVGAAFAFFSFAERVTVAGDSRAFYLTFAATVDGTGRSNHGNPQLRASVPVYVHAIYTPLRTSAELSPAWAYRDGGTLRWNLVDAQLRPVGGEATIATGGAFDEPESVDGRERVAPQAGVACLVDRRGGSCPAAAPTDVRTLIAKTGADGALVDYRRRVQPHCVERADGAGNVVCDRAVQSVAVSSRTLSFGSGCASTIARYRNVGATDQTLERSAERYWVDARGGAPRQIGARRDLVATGARAYDRQVELPAASAAAVAATMIVNPLGEQPALVPIDEGGAALRQLAPLRTDFAAGGAGCR
jgi:hypothetical protein